MAGLSLDFRNTVGSTKCAVSSPRIANLEIGDESPVVDGSDFQGLFRNYQVSCNDVGNSSNLIYGRDKFCDKKFLIHSQSSLSTSKCDDRPSDKIKSTYDNDTDFGLLDLLNSAKFEQTEGTGGEIFSKKNKSNDKMKIISNGEVSDGLSDLLSSIVHGSSEKDEVDATLKYRPRKYTQEGGINLLDFDFVQNESADSSTSNNSSLKVEPNLSDLLSSVTVEDFNVAKAEISNSSSMCKSRTSNNFKTEKESSVADLSDLLSSIDSLDSIDNKVGSYDQGNMCHAKIVKTKDELCLADLLPSIEKSGKEESVTDLSDLLSSIDLGDSNYIKVGNYIPGNTFNTKVVNTENESCLSDLLSCISIEDSNKSISGVLNSKSSGCGNSNLCLETNGITDSPNDFVFDTVSCSSTSNSCASSYSETESNSPKDSLTKSNLTNKIFEADSGYNSYDSANKEFSFFDYSSDNQFSFNTILTKKSDAGIPIKCNDRETSRNTNEEMSMSDLMTLVSPEFRNPVLATLNKVQKIEGHVNKDDTNMLDLIESLSINSKNSDCIDGRISMNVPSGMITSNVQASLCLKKDNKLSDRSDLVNDDDNVASDDEHTTVIDLRECIKSAKNQLIPSSPIKQLKSIENRSLECFSPNENQFYSEDKLSSDLLHTKSNPFEFKDTIPRKKSRVNTKQTMFSKALACKPKKDHAFLQKVANIKNELLNDIIHRPVFIDCDVPQPKIESVLQSDRCILSNLGRRAFGMDAPCEV